MGKLNRRERPTHNEKPETKICKKWLVMESCSKCIFENLCGFEERCKQIIQQQEK